MTIRPLLLTALLAACAPDFEDRTTVKDLRILAIEVDPPEILIDVGDLATIETLPTAADLAKLQAAAMGLPETFDPVRVRPLVVDPAGRGRAVRFRLVACGNAPPAQGRERDRGPGGVRDTISRATCPTGSAVVAEGDAVPAGNPPDVVVEMHATFVPTRDLLRGALAADPLGVIFGLPIVIELTVSAGGEHAIGRKRVIFGPRLSADQAPNSNPAIPRLGSRKSREDAPKVLDLAASERELPAVSLGAKLLLTPEREPATPYPARVFKSDTKRLATLQVDKETLRYAFFATAGKFSPASSSTEPSPLRDKPTDGLTVTYEAPKALGPEAPRTAHVWIVARDERGGSSFVRFALPLTP